MKRWIGDVGDFGEGRGKGNVAGHDRDLVPVHDHDYVGQTSHDFRLHLHHLSTDVPSGMMGTCLDDDLRMVVYHNYYSVVGRIRSPSLVDQCPVSMVDRRAGLIRA